MEDIRNEKESMKDESIVAEDRVLTAEEIQSNASKEAERAFYPGPKKAGYVFFVLSVLTFALFIFFTTPFLSIFFSNSTKDLGEALGKMFGLIFAILMMGLTGIPHLIFSLTSTLLFGTAIKKTDKAHRAKTIVFFAISLALLVIALSIALISFIVIKTH